MKPVKCSFCAAILCVLGSFAAVALPANTNRPSDVQREPVGQVAGVIRARSGIPVPGVFVQLDQALPGKPPDSRMLYSVSSAAARARAAVETLTYLATTPTTADGSFVISNVAAPACFIVSVSQETLAAEGLMLRSYPSPDACLVQTLPQETSCCQLTYQPTPIIFIRMVDSNGQAITRYSLNVPNYLGGWSRQIVHTSTWVAIAPSVHFEYSLATLTVLAATETVSSMPTNIAIHPWPTTNWLVLLAHPCPPFLRGFAQWPNGSPATGMVIRTDVDQCLATGEEGRFNFMAITDARGCFSLYGLPVPINPKNRMVFYYAPMPQATSVCYVMNPTSGISAVVLHLPAPAPAVVASAPPPLRTELVGKIANQENLPVSARMSLRSERRASWGSLNEADGTFSFSIDNSGPQQLRLLTAYGTHELQLNLAATQAVIDIGTIVVTTPPSVAVMLSFATPDGQLARKITLWKTSKDLWERQNNNAMPWREYFMGMTDRHGVLFTRLGQEAQEGWYFMQNDTTYIVAMFSVSTGVQRCIARAYPTSTHNLHLLKNGRPFIPNNWFLRHCASGFRPSIARMGNGYSLGAPTGQYVVVAQDGTLVTTANLTSTPSTAVEFLTGTLKINQPSSAIHQLTAALHLLGETYPIVSNAPMSEYQRSRQLGGRMDPRLKQTAATVYLAELPVGQYTITTEFKLTNAVGSLVTSLQIHNGATSTLALTVQDK